MAEDSHPSLHGSNRFCPQEKGACPSQTAGGLSTSLRTSSGGTANEPRRRLAQGLTPFPSGKRLSDPLVAGGARGRRLLRDWLSFSAGKRCLSLSSRLACVTGWRLAHQLRTTSLPAGKRCLSLSSRLACVTGWRLAHQLRTTSLPAGKRCLALSDGPCNRAPARTRARPFPSAASCELRATARDAGPHVITRALSLPKGPWQSRRPILPQRRHTPSSLSDAKNLSERRTSEHQETLQRPVPRKDLHPAEAALRMTTRGVEPNTPSPELTPPSQRARPN